MTFCCFVPIVAARECVCLSECLLHVIREQILNAKMQKR